MHLSPQSGSKLKLKRCSSLHCRARATLTWFDNGCLIYEFFIPQTRGLSARLSKGVGIASLIFYGHRHYDLGTCIWLTTPKIGQASWSKASFLPRYLRNIVTATSYRVLRSSLLPLRL